MGQAKRRGTFDERKKAATDKRSWEIEKRKSQRGSLRNSEAGRILSLFGAIAFGLASEKTVRRIEKAKANLRKNK